MYQILSDIQNGEGSNEQVEKLEDICDNMSFKCFCALGDAAVAPVSSSIRHFRSDYDELIKKLTPDSIAG
jgi:NADH-quinone oxidoreductase subunit F